ncbi:hypothetical protein VTK56DRAFT_1126 [Thermocarpiscus australiensis]
MSSQGDAGIPLFHALDGTGYKLLELPPELLELLESPNPPTLTLHPSPTAALLKTPQGKTYSLRQKNTSNALILLTPSATTTTGTAPEGTQNQNQNASPGPATAAARSGLDAIAMVHETIELIPETDEAAAAAAAARPRGKWHEKFGRGR